MHNLLHNNGIISCSSTRDETTLIRANQPIHNGANAVHQNFGDKLMESTRIIRLRNKDYHSLRNTRIKDAGSESIPNKLEHRVSHHIPVLLIEESLKTIRPRSLKGSH